MTLALMPKLKGARAVVYGLGKSGGAAARLLVKQGAKVTGLDARSEQELGASAAELKGGLEEASAGLAG